MSLKSKRRRREVSVNEEPTQTAAISTNGIREQSEPGLFQAQFQQITMKCLSSCRPKLFHRCPLQKFQIVDKLRLER